MPTKPEIDWIVGRTERMESHARSLVRASLAALDAASRIGSPELVICCVDVVKDQAKYLRQAAEACRNDKEGS